MMESAETRPGEGDATTSPGRGSVMVVDDQPANLKLMEDMLRREGYGVRSFPRGRLALAAAAQQLPDLILLDINMPEMDGFEVCARLKSDAKLGSIPVIFLSALNETEDKVRAFRTGGVDYITKPFRFEEVQSRVETHLGLLRARRAEHELLEKTLNGAVKALADLVHLAGASLAARSDSLRSIAAHLTSKLGLDEPWQYELAAILCLVGCIALPDDTFVRAYGHNPGPSDEEMFRSHPETGARLLARIPRLENVSEMIRRQQTACGSARPRSVVETGACMMRIAVELDRWMFKGLTFRAALGHLKALARDFSPEMMEALEDYSPPQLAFEIKCLPLNELRASMVAENDILTRDGNILIVPRGATLTPTGIDRIRNFDKTRGVHEPIQVRIPRNEGN